MTMNGMDMGGMGAMDMGSEGTFKETNMKIARIYWYLVAGIVGILAVRRGLEWGRTRLTLTAHQRRQNRISSKPGKVLLQVYDTTIAICRELAYPQIYWLSGPFTRFLNAPALGGCLLLFAYWIVILTALWTDTILMPSSPDYAYKWEIVGFRAAWVSVTQLPLIYCLACKVNIISMITGISYERLNWLHRWVARTMFLTVIVHWSFFFREWWIADFVQFELQLMPMVKYGFGAWSVLGWMALTGFGFFRQLSHELFIVQHIASFAVLLWLVYTHIPSYAQYNVWLAVAFVALDRSSRWIGLVWCNLHLSFSPDGEEPAYLFGFSTRAEVSTGDYVLLTIEEIRIPWRAGQHLYLTIPACGVFESHPFTIAGLPDRSRNARLILKAHSGFTRRLLRQIHERPDKKLRALISPPYGLPPLAVIERSDSLILLATSTGASFIVPIMQHALNTPNTIRRVCFYWIIRHESHTDWFSSELGLALQKFRSLGVKVSLHIFVTEKPCISTPSHATRDSSSTSTTSTALPVQEINPTEVKFLLPSGQDEKDIREEIVDHQTRSTSSISYSNESTSTIFPTTFGRPISIDPLIRPTVEDSDGETAIIACGSAGFLAELRNYVAALSDERAVHKGTGAQGIFLFTETYAW